MHQCLRLLALAPVLLCGLFTQTACDSVPKIVRDNPELARLGIAVATVEVIDDDAARARRVVDLARYVKTHSADLKVATVAALEEAVRAKIDWDELAQDPLRYEAAETLIVVARRELLKRLPDGKLSEDGALLLAEVCGWIESTAMRELARLSPLPPPA